jgi:hypothetical protein
LPRPRGGLQGFFVRLSEHLIEDGQEPLFGRPVWMVLGYLPSEGLERLHPVLVHK